MATPAWSAATSGSASTANQVDQFLGTHASYTTYDSALPSGTDAICSTSGALGISPLGLQNFNSHPVVTQAVDQPFTITAAVPLTRMAISFQTQPYHGADIVASIQTDNGSGFPSGTLAGGGINQITIPKEFIAASARADLFPDWNPCIQSGWISTNSGNLGDPPFSLVFFPSGASDGQFMYVVGGITPDSAHTQAASWFAPIQVNNFGAWQSGTPLPIPTGGTAGTGTALFNMVYAAGYLVAMGGENDSGAIISDVYTAPANGSIGSWTTQPSLPGVRAAGQAVAITSVQTGVANTIPTIVYVGGNDGTNIHNTVWSATLNNGQLSAWTTLPSFPANLWAGQMQYVNGWLVVASGAADAAKATVVNNTWASKVTVNASGIVSLGPWQAWPNMGSPPGHVGVFSAQSAVCNNCMIIMGGQSSNTPTYSQFVQAIRVGTFGPAGTWVQQGGNTAYPISGSSFGLGMTVVSGSTTSFFGTTSGAPNNTTVSINMPGANGSWPGISVDSSTLNFVSVPFHVTGLATSTTYHLVLKQADSYVYNDNLAQIVSFSIGSATPANVFQNGAWQQLIIGNFAYAIGIIGYQSIATPAGRVIHTLDDNGQKWTWNLYLKWNGQFTGYGEYAGNTRKFYLVNYDQPTSLVQDSLGATTGWGASLWSQDKSLINSNTLPTPSQPLEWGS